MKEHFDEFYRKIYGGRWETLRESLLLPARTIPYSQGLACPYFLDGASVLAALSLRLPDDAPASGAPPEKPPLILDACAAPGGKAMVIASTMGGNTELLANDLSSERRRRLEAALDKHLPPETRARVKVSGFDAAAAAGRKSEQGRFAAVLLDAPCSSERHVIQDNAALEQWTQARPRSLARRQWALLSAAFLLLAPGGSLVYATCSINPEENDGVASKLMKKYANCILDMPDFSEGEDCNCGKLILPDVSGGLGPLYVARFGKTPALAERHMGISIRARQAQEYQKYLNNCSPSLAMESQGISLAALLPKKFAQRHRGTEGRIRYCRIKFIRIHHV